MSVKPLTSDNPLQDSNLPKMKVSLNLPAIPTQVVQSEFLAGPVHFLMTALFLGAIAAVAFFYPDQRQWLHFVQAICLVAMAVLIAIRVRFIDIQYAVLLIILANTTAALVAANIAINCPTNVYGLSIFITEMYALAMLEFGWHFRVLAYSSYGGVATNDAEFESRCTKAVVNVFAIVVSLAFAIVVTQSQLVCWVVAIAAYFRGRKVCAQQDIGSGVRGDMLISFFTYPTSHQLRFGQIASPSGLVSNRYLAPTHFRLLMPIFGLLVCGLQLRAELLGWLVLPFVILHAGYDMVISYVSLGIVNDKRTLWRKVVDANRNSPNSIQRESLFLGQVAADGTPILFNRSNFQHMHFLGAPGSGKTSMGLMPLLEQLVSFGDTTTIVIDLKADSHELLSAAVHANKELAERNGASLPIRVFSLENGDLTHAFNPFLTTGWASRSIYERTDIICAATGLYYGTEYGRAFFTAANSAVIASASNANPGNMSFAQLHEDVDRILLNDTGELHPEIRRAGVHAGQVIARLASYQSLNVTPNADFPKEVMDQQIDLMDCFQTPQILYFKLPSTISPIGAPALARLILYFLLVAGKPGGRRVKVNVVIDEFQRMVSDSLDSLFEMARGLDVRLILANQNMSDLGKVGESMLQTIEANCGVRQWFSVNGSVDMASVVSLFGVKEEVDITETVGERVTRTYRKVEKPRLSITDLHQISDDPTLSVMRIGGTRDGYSKFGGVPFVARSSFHISSDEFVRRTQLAWPNSLPGMMRAQELIPKVQPRFNFSPKKTKRPRSSPPVSRPDDEQSFPTFE